MSIQEQLIEYVIQDVIEMIVINQKLEYDEAMNKFYNSEVFDKLQDKETELYKESPAYVYDLFRDEMNFGHMIQGEIWWYYKGVKIIRFIVYFRKWLYKYAWEQRKLDTITDVRDGTHDSPQYVETGHPFITSKNVKDGFINFEDIQYVSDKDYEEINKRSKVDKNDILMGMIGTIGNIALVRETPDFTIKNVALIKDIGDVFYCYLYHCLQANSVAHQLSENLDGGTQKFIALNKIRELAIPVPSMHEQHKIGDYMESLDNLITLHQRKLEKFKNIKNAYLEEMFV